MAVSAKSLAQLVPMASAETALYTVPPGTQSTQLTSLVVCNQASAPTIFSVRVRVGGAALDPKQFIYFQVPLQANQTMTLSQSGMALLTGDVIQVASPNGQVSFNLFGLETSE